MLQGLCDQCSHRPPRPPTFCSCSLCNKLRVSRSHMMMSAGSGYESTSVKLVEHVCEL
jgi:hypothetical protein